MIKRTTKQIREHRRTQRAVQDRRRQYQEICSAERLIRIPGGLSAAVVPLDHSSTARSTPMSASSMASPPTPSTKSTRPPRAIIAANTIRVAKQAVEKAGQYAFRDRERQAPFYGTGSTLNTAVSPLASTQPLRRRSARSGHHCRPQGAVRSRSPRAGGVQAIVEKAKAALPAQASLSCPAQAGHTVTAAYA